MPKIPGKTLWPADRVERRKVADLAPYAGNARKHSDAQVAQIARSIQEFGFTVPVLIDTDGTIIAGHGRVMAAQRLGLKEVPVMVAEGWTEAQRRAYSIADNKLTLNGEWDVDVLQAEFEALRVDGFDLSLTGFEPGELQAPGSAPGSIEEPPASKYSEQYGVIVICGSEDEQRATYERLNSEGLNCRVVTT